jgi:hypothetical protein
MQAQQSSLIKRIYGSVEAAKAAWAEQERRARAREAARQYVRGGGSSISVFGRRADRQGKA